MNIHFNLSETDYLHFNLFHVKHSKTARKALLMQRWTGPVLFLILSYLFSTITDISFLLSFSTFFVISVIWFVFYPKYFFSLIIRHTKKMLKEGQNDGLIGEHRLMISEKGITDYTSNGESHANWSGIKELKEDDQYFYLYNTSVSAYILPKSAITNVDEVRSYINNHFISSTVAKR